MRQLLRYYDTDAEPPQVPGISNATVIMGLNILCATPVGDFVSIEGLLVVVSISSGVYNQRRKSHRAIAGVTGRMSSFQHF